MNIFEKATRCNLLFPAEGRGNINIQTLWNLPLTSTTSVSLDSIAMHLQDEINTTSGKSFVNKGSSAASELNELRLKIVVHIIEVIKKEQEDKVAKAEKQAQIRILEKALMQKQTEEMTTGTAEELKARLNKLKEG